MSFEFFVNLKIWENVFHMRPCHIASDEVLDKSLSTRTDSRIWTQTTSSICLCRDILCTPGRNLTLVQCENLIQIPNLRRSQDHATDNIQCIQ